MNDLRGILPILAAFALVVLVGIGGCKLERYVHYKFSYQSKVAEQIKPLENRIDHLSNVVVRLERRLETLEKK